MQKNMRRWILALTLFVLLATFGFASAYGATEGTSEGTASVQSAVPTVTNSDIWNQTETGSVNFTFVDVQVEYRVNCTVTDNNQLYDLENVTFIIWEGLYYDEGSPNNEAYHYTFKYDNDTDTWSEIDTSGHLISANCSDPADHSQTSGEFKLAFKLSKIADYTSGKTWNTKIYAFDGAGNNGSQKILYFGVNYYAEMTVDDGTHGWSGLSPGDTDVQITSPGDGDIDITVTSNDNFDVQAKSNSSVLQTSPTGDTIGIGNVTIHETTLGSSVSLTTSYADIGGLTNEASGADQAKSFKLWIDVPIGTPDGEYKYTLYVQVVQS